MKTDVTFEMRLKEVQERFVQWRAQHGQRRRPIPPALWKAAAALARTYGVFPVARALRLEYTKLKEQRGRSVPARACAGHLPFVEVAMGPPTFGDGCLVEMEKRSGARLRIRWAANAPRELVDLAQVFLRSR